MSETTNKESEEFPDKEIFRFGTEKFDEVVEGKVEILDWPDYPHYGQIFNNKEDSAIELAIGKSFKNKDKVKISCKPGKIVIERMEK